MQNALIENSENINKVKSDLKFISPRDFLDIRLCGAGAGVGGGQTEDLQHLGGRPGGVQPGCGHGGVPGRAAG